MRTDVLSFPVIWWLFYKNPTIWGRCGVLLGTKRSMLQVVLADAFTELAGVPKEVVSPSTKQVDALKLNGNFWEFKLSIAEWLFGVLLLAEWWKSFNINN